MQAGEGLSLEQIRAFLKSSEEVEFKARDRGDVYAWVCQALHQQRYRELKRRSRGLVRRYLEKLTGLSRAQITRLIAMYMEGKPVQPKLYRRRRFPQRYTQEDIVLLAATDEAHETPSGPAMRKILERAYYDFRESKYRRLAELSVAQMYRLRKSRTYRQRRVAYQPTRPTQVAIGERRRPEPDGRPGYLRVDTVHQGDLNGVKGAKAKGGVPHQCRGPSYAMANSGRYGADPGCGPKAAAKRICCPCWKPCWRSFRFAFEGFIPTTAASSSTIQ